MFQRKKNENIKMHIDFLNRKHNNYDLEFLYNFYSKIEEIKNNDIDVYDTNENQIFNNI